MKIIKKIGIVFVTIILVLLLTFNVYNFFCLNFLNKDLATVNGYGLLEVITGSMEPTIHVGDLIVIDTNYKDYKDGDIITFYDVDNSFVTHRIVSINDTQMITKGDNNNTEDEPLNRDRIIGKYIMKINGFGKITNSLKNPVVMVMILLIGIMVCFLVSTDKNGNPILTDEEKEFLEYKKEKEKKKKEN